MSERPLRAVIYARVSTDKQVGGPSLEEQLILCRRYAAQQGMVQVAEIQDGFTGKVLERPGFSQVLKKMREKKADVLIVAVHDRLSRNFIDFLILREQLTKNGFQLHYARTAGQATDDFGSLMTDTIQALLAHGERLKIAERTKEGRLAHARRGRIVQARLPYGYARDDKKNVFIVEEEAHWVRKIFTWFVDGNQLGKPFKIRQIVAELDKRGVPTANNAKGWHPATVYKILKNPFYAGTTYFGQSAIDAAGNRVDLPRSEWIVVPTPPIISETLYQRCQKQLEINRVQSKRGRKLNYMLTGHIKCKSCGSSVVGVSRVHRDKTKPNSRYYRCGSATLRDYWEKYEKCSAGYTMIKAEPLERAVLRWFLDFISEDEILISSLKKMEELAYNALDEKRERLDWVSKKIIEEENLIDRLIEHFKGIDNKKVQESLSEQVYQAAARIDLLKTEQATLDAEITKESFSEKTQERILDMAREVRERLRYVSYDNMRFALNALGVTVSILIDPEDKKRLKVWITTGFPSAGVRIELPLSWQNRHSTHTIKLTFFFILYNNVQIMAPELVKKQ